MKRKTKPIRIKDTVEVQDSTPITQRLSIASRKEDKVEPVSNPFKDVEGDWVVKDEFKELTPRDAMSLLASQEHMFGVKDVYFVDDLEAPKCKLLGVRYFEKYPYFMFHKDKGNFVASHCFIKSTKKKEIKNG